MSLHKMPGWVGVDEAGRGPLAGPVVVAAVLLPRSFDCEGIDDSKRLCPAERERLAERIRGSAKWKIAWADSERIDQEGILRATLRLMAELIESLPPGKGALVDGNQRPPCLRPTRLEVDGDARFVPIAAASILAKTFRDRWMLEADAKYPGYGFADHKGYSTREHKRLLRILGPCQIHRRSFRPVAEVCQPELFEGETTHEARCLVEA